VRRTLTFDIETHEAGLLYTMAPEDFVRLIGYRWAGQPDVVLTTDLEEIRAQILKARWIIGHNIHSFDLPAVFGIRSDTPLELAMQKRVYDTWTHAVLVHPAPYRAVNRHGADKVYGDPDAMKQWFGLDEQAFQLGVVGKTDDLKLLAYEFGEPELPKKERIKDGFGKIPVDDERYRAYLVGDVDASDRVAKELVKLAPLDDYAMREQEIEARKAVISANGIRVDQPRAKARVAELAARKAVVMEGLVRDYDFPTAGKAPWATNPGKEAIFEALADQGITEQSRPGWTRTAKSQTHPQGTLSLGGDVLKKLTEGTAAEDLGTALAELKGQRSLAQLALDSTHSDGFCHPQITMLQRSGRWSVTQPGLTVWTNSGPGAIEKAYFVPDSDDELLVELDYSNADARVVAALSGDTKYAERFEPGADGHMVNAVAAWGQSVVDTDPKGYRQKAKVPGHSWAYRVGARTLARNTGLSEAVTKTFLEGMNKAFHRVVAWQNRSVAYAKQHGYVINPWGRKMWVEKGHEYTQAPALEGQSGTREIVCDSLLKMPIPVLRTVKIQIHDALLFSLPKASIDRSVPYLKRLMAAEMSPKGGQHIDFPVSAGQPAADWFEARHE
jgi:DNA polymerase I